jgi:hypothetical protein
MLREIYMPWLNIIKVAVRLNIAGFTILMADP